MLFRSKIFKRLKFEFVCTFTFTRFIQWNVWTKKIRNIASCRLSWVGIRGKSCLSFWCESIQPYAIRAYNGVACETGNAVERFLYLFCISHIYTKVKMYINSKCESITKRMKNRRPKALRCWTSWSWNASDRLEWREVEKREITWNQKCYVAPWNRIRVELTSNECSRRTSGRLVCVLVSEGIISSRRVAFQTDTLIDANDKFNVVIVRIALFARNTCAEIMYTKQNRELANAITSASENRLERTTYR